MGRWRAGGFLVGLWPRFATAAQKFVQTRRFTARQRSDRPQWAGYHRYFTGFGAHSVVELEGVIISRRGIRSAAEQGSAATTLKGGRLYVLALQRWWPDRLGIFEAGIFGRLVKFFTGPGVGGGDVAQQYSQGVVAVFVHAQALATP